MPKPIKIRDETKVQGFRYNGEILEQKVETKEVFLYQTPTFRYEWIKL